MSYWKARAIYHGKGVFDILHDRMKSSGPDARELCAWLNETAFPIIRDGMKRDATPTSSSCVFEVDEGAMHLWSSPNASYGYLYIKAWTDESERAMEEDKGYF